MPSRSKSVKKTKRSKTKLIVLFIIIIAAIVAGVWRIWFYTPSSKVITKVGNQPKSVTSSSIKNSYGVPATSTPKEPSSNNDSSRTIGGPVDTNGNSIAATPKSQWVTSDSGAITVEQPIANATLTSGSILSGTANVGTVSYTLLDDNVGVISQGSLSVVNGKFSGKIIFTPHSSGGRLDVYSTNSQGVELNDIQIGVNF